MQVISEEVKRVINSEQKQSDSIMKNGTPSISSEPKQSDSIMIYKTPSSEN